MGKLTGNVFGIVAKLAVAAYLLIALVVGATGARDNHSTVWAIAQGATWPITLIVDRQHSEEQKAAKVQAEAAVTDALAKDRALHQSLSTLPTTTKQPDMLNGQNPALDMALSRTPSEGGKNDAEQPK